MFLATLAASRRRCHGLPMNRADNLEDRALTDQIEGIAEEFPQYGSRKVTAKLHREGLLVNHKKIQRERGLGVKKRCRFVRTAYSNHPYPVYPNLIKHRLMTGINQVWVAISLTFESRWPSLTWRLFWIFIPARPSAIPFRMRSTRI